MLPRAPQAVINSLLEGQETLNHYGINHTRTRLAYFIANLEHETDGFTIRNLTENINYTPSRAAEIWPSRFSSPQDVIDKYGQAPGWQLAMFDDVYGNRMGNRRGTHDGSRYIGRGGPQWTGREGYEELERATSLPCVDQPELAAAPDNQAEVSAAFWAWKNLNELADVGNFSGVVRRWNGGQIGIKDRRARLEGNDAWIEGFDDVLDPNIKQTIDRLPGNPPMPRPPREVMDRATKNERNVILGGAGTGAGGATTTMKDGSNTPLLSPVITYTMIGVGLAALLIGFVLLSRKKQAIIEHWR